jgi:hypothetical protein
MTQAQDTPTWCVTFQLKLMAALDAAWKTIEAASDPAVIRQARDKAKAVGELAAMARKVALIVPTPRGKPQLAETVAAGLAATKAVGDLELMVRTPAPPAAAQAEPARRALDKLKGGWRGRL